MDIIFFIISMLALGITFATFFSMILNNGLKGALDLSRKSVKFMVGSFLIYIVCFAVFILMQI